ncbi:hypothetical protein AAVH_19069 [Aphelenchoides avenae]|nr:hypothetical protein AAVH_19069 [Aphelenchus avenae]
MNRQIIGYAFEENKRLTRRDLERHALEVWCEGYEGVELAGSTEVLDTSRRPPAYVVADAYARLKDCQCYRIYANAARCDIGDAEEAESASDSELTKPQPYAKHAQKAAGNIFECSVCYGEFPTKEAVGCQSNEQTGKKHLFCVNCTIDYVHVAVGELPLAKNFDGVRCMEDGCEQAICTGSLPSVLDEGTVDRLQERCTRELLRNIPGLERCKFEDCGFAQEVTQSTEQNLYFFCPLCQVTFCRMCKRNIDVHLDSTCEQLEKAERDEAERQRKNAVEDAKRIEINKLSEQINEAKIRKCPVCKESQLKNDDDGSCSKMTCKCGATYCYLCLEPNIRYDHFKKYVAVFSFCVILILTMMY